MRKAVPLVRHIGDMRGSKTYKVEKLVSLYSVYSTPATKESFMDYFRSAKILMNHSIRFYRGGVEIEDKAYIKELNIDELIGLCDLHGITLEWTNETYKKLIHLK